MSDNTMHYRGYKAVVQYSAEDESFVGVVVGIKDRIAFAGDSVEEITADIHAMIDSYIANNKAIGREPNQPADYVPVPVDPALYEAAKGRVQGTSQTVNEFVNIAVQQALYPQHA
jgi:predicted HicB family RNase H-like nuclease